MDPRLLTLYEDELKYLREMGAEYGAAYPNIMGRLGLNSTPCPDPYVERLLEGVAFLSARVQLKLNARYPDFTQHLLQVVYPHFLTPVPSCGIAQFNPLLTEGSLQSGVTIPRHSRLFTVPSKGERTPCEFRTAHPVTMWPLEISATRYVSGAGALANFGIPTSLNARAALILSLRSSAGLALKRLPLDSLVFHITSDGEGTAKLHEQIFANALGVLVKKTGSGAVLSRQAGSAIAPVGFAEDESLLPRTERSFVGYRLLQEYFACPARFLFFRLEHLSEGFSLCDAQDVDVCILFDRAQSSLDGVLSAGAIRLNCTPVVNLFHRTLDRVHVTPKDVEYQVIADRNRPTDFEIFCIERMRAIYAEGSPVAVSPIYAAGYRDSSAAQPMYYTQQRRPRMLSARERLRGSRSSYVGTEMFVSLSAESSSFSTVRQLDIDALCTNRDLPMNLTPNAGKTDFVLDGAAPVDSIRCIHGPTVPRTSPAFGETAWRLISHLSLNYLSLVDTTDAGPQMLRELLGLYADAASSAHRRQIEGVRGIECTPVVRRIPAGGPISFARGLAITLKVDEGAFSGAGPMLLAAVLEYFFARHVSLNSFVQLRLVAQDGELIKVWPIRTGARELL